MKLLDHIKATYGVKNDRQFANAIDISTPVISRIRNGKSGVSAEIMIKIHEIYGMPIADIKKLCAETTSEQA